MTGGQPRGTSTEKVVLAGVRSGRTDAALFEQDMNEMAQLCATAGAQVVATVTQRREAPVASTFIGSGKLVEIRELMRAHDCTTFIIDAELSPGQVHNIEKALDGKVIDRNQLILDIFAQHATSVEARIQVELAQMRTLYPRLTHAWSHFSQQVGGIGTRGPGEKQLEVDRRLVQRRITDLQRRLKDVEGNRVEQRKSRRAHVNVVIVGYTNVGKSSLLNALSRAEVTVANRLFATLDTTTRRCFVPEAGIVMLTDTVGFIRKLPHHLVASFRSTLEVACDADLLLVVHDASSAWVDAQQIAVAAVLEELGACEAPQLAVFNKADRCADAFARKQFELTYPGALFVSAVTGEGIDTLKQRIGELIRSAAGDRQVRRIVDRKSRSYTSSGLPSWLEK